MTAVAIAVIGVTVWAAALSLIMLWGSTPRRTK